MVLSTATMPHINRVVTEGILLYKTISLTESINKYNGFN